jgi:hypothetical protein
MFRTMDVLFLLEMRFLFVVVDGLTFRMVVFKYDGIKSEYRKVSKKVESGKSELFPCSE